jgi:RNA polymerase sigma-70 factor (ECF subfamily)
MGATTAELEQLYRSRYRMFLDGMTRVVRDPESAREVVQEAFARALRSRRRFRGDASLEAWVWRIAVNEALRARRGLLPGWNEDADEIAAAPDAAPDSTVRDAVRALPPRRRLVVFLRYFADLSYGEIATICQISEGTVAATLAQSHDELSEHLRAEGAST